MAILHIRHNFKLLWYKLFSFVSYCSLQLRCLSQVLAKTQVCYTIIVVWWSYAACHLRRDLISPGPTRAVLLWPLVPNARTFISCGQSYLQTVPQTSAARLVMVFEIQAEAYLLDAQVSHAIISNAMLIWSLRKSLSLQCTSNYRLWSWWLLTKCFDIDNTARLNIKTHLNVPFSHSRWRQKS